jgi:hypothetical protein
MDVGVVGFEPDQCAEIDEAVHFFADILFHKNMQRRLGFTIQRCPELELKGQCWPEDDHCRLFVVDICCKHFDDDALDTLAHEMIHCKQWAKGELGIATMTCARTDPSGVIQLAPMYIELWHGKPWKPSPGEDSYFDRPWEVEAYGRSVGMMARWKTRKKAPPARVTKTNPGVVFSSLACYGDRPGPDYAADYYGGA